MLTGLNLQSLPGTCLKARKWIVSSGFVEFEELLDLLEQVAVSMLRFVEETAAAVLADFGVEKIAFGQIPRLTLRAAQRDYLSRDRPG